VLRAPLADLQSDSAPNPEATNRRTLEEAEREHILSTLKESKSEAKLGYFPIAKNPLHLEAHGTTCPMAVLAEEIFTLILHLIQTRFADTSVD
jgi:hypothetical protein